jgi:biopolymer transport protein ExbB/TolQ
MIEYINLFPVADMASAFWQSTLPGKMIVLILFVGSAAAWTIMWTKGQQLRNASAATKRFLVSFRESSNPLNISSPQKQFTHTPLEVIYQEGCRAVELELQGEDRRGSPGTQLSMHQLETIRAVVDRTLADEVLLLEDQMGLLATAVSAAPFLGLLGTVWGVMDAFSGMAMAGNAALSAVAPGISGALLTTIIGLIVALPSMIGYNLLSAEIRRISVQMDNFAQEFVSGVQKKYVVGAQ